MPPLSNDALRLTPRTAFEGPALDLDFPGIEIGVAEYDEGPTGCTVFHFPGGPLAVVKDVRGGSPATVGGYERVDAICLAGGSAYGLEAASGVAAELFARRGHSTAWTDIALVAGAIVFDYGPRGSAVYPARELGRAALRAARPGRFLLGARGAGRSVTVGKTFDYAEREPAGQGGAFRQVGPSRVAVFTVVNALGAIVDREGRVVRGHLDAATGEREPLATGLERRLAGGAPGPLPGNTTLTVVVTNERLDPRSLRQLARQVHASIARGIQPFHHLLDGDVLFAVTTDEVEHLGPATLGLLASELAWDAVLSSVQ